MPFGLLPILAQTVSLSAGDRTEVRYVVDRNVQAVQAETRAESTFRLSGRTWTAALTYAPSLYAGSVVPPLELTFLQTVTQSAAARIQRRRTSLTLGESAAFAQTNQRVTALSGSDLGLGPQLGDQPPASSPGSDTPSGAGAMQPTPAGPSTASSPSVISAQGETLEYASLGVFAGLAHTLSRTVSLTESLSYGVDLGVGERSHAVYPTTRRADASVSLTYGLSRRDQMSTSLSGANASNSLGAKAWTLSLQQGYTRSLGPRTQGSLAVGVALTHAVEPSGTARTAAYELAQGSLEHTAGAWGGVLSLQTTAWFAPVIDRVTSAIDPRFGIRGALAWNNRRRLTLAVSLASTSSATPSRVGALTTLNAEASATYLLGSGFYAETGVRGAWTSFEQVEVVPPSAAVFAALSWRGSLSSR